MDARSNTHGTGLAQWMEDSEAHADTTAPASHRSRQVSAEREYVAEICGRFAGEKSEEKQKSCVVRGYN
jgi:hypothetical protein